MLSVAFTTLKEVNVPTSFPLQLPLFLKVHLATHVCNRRSSHQGHLPSAAQPVANRDRTLCEMVMISSLQEGREETSPRSHRHRRGHRRTAEQR